MKNYIKLYRINLSHTPIDLVEKHIDLIQKWTDIPICLDSEGAQLRNQNTKENEALLKKDEVVKIHFDEVEGDSKNLSFSPEGIADQFEVGNTIRIDFNMVRLRVTEKNDDHCLAKVEIGGKIGSNKAADIDKNLELESITAKDKAAIDIGVRMGIKCFALSFASSRESVASIRKIAGNDAIIISKIESLMGLSNLDDILWG